MKYVKSILRTDERIIKTAEISKKALIITWVSIPSVFLIAFLFVYLPNVIKSKINDEIENRLIGEWNLFNIIETTLESSFSVPNAVIVLLKILIGLIIAIWLVWCFVMTKRHFCYELVYTDFRVIGRAKRKKISVPLKQVKNIFFENTLFGKILGYATITVTSDKGSVTVRNVAHAQQFVKDLRSVTIDSEIRNDEERDFFVSK